MPKIVLYAKKLENEKHCTRLGEEDVIKILKYAQKHMKLLTEFPKIVDSFGCFLVLEPGESKYLSQEENEQLNKLYEKRYRKRDEERVTSH